MTGNCSRRPGSDFPPVADLMGDAALLFLRCDDVSNGPKRRTTRQDGHMARRFQLPVGGLWLARSPEFSLLVTQTHRRTVLCTTCKRHLGRQAFTVGPGNDACYQRVDPRQQCATSTIIPVDPLSSLVLARSPLSPLCSPSSSKLGFPHLSPSSASHAQLTHLSPPCVLLLAACLPSLVFGPHISLFFSARLARSLSRSLAHRPPAQLRLALGSRYQERHARPAVRWRPAILPSAAPSGIGVRSSSLRYAFARPGVPHLLASW